MNPKLKKLFLILLVLLVVGGTGFWIFQKLFPYSPISPLKRQCPILEVKKETVRGDSLRPIIEPGQKVTILYNYYSCFNIIRDDIVAYPYAGQEEPIIKIVRGIPGDKFYLQRQKVGDRWNIYINRKVLVNSQGTIYNIPPENVPLLQLYERENNYTIPKDAYLILGNLPQGSLDSTRFGLVHKSDILGKVVK